VHPPVNPLDRSKPRASGRADHGCSIASDRVRTDWIRADRNQARLYQFPKQHPREPKPARVWASELQGKGRTWPV